MSNYQAMQADKFSTDKGRALVADCERNIEKCIGNTTGEMVINRLCSLIPGMDKHAAKLAAENPTAVQLRNAFSACRAMMDQMDGVEWSWDMTFTDCILSDWRS